MSYRKLFMIDVKEVLRRWSAGQGDCKMRVGQAPIEKPLHDTQKPPRGSGSSAAAG